MRTTPLFFLLASILACGISAQQGKPTKAKTPPWQTLGLDQSIQWTMDPEIFIDARRSKRKITGKVDRESILNEAIDRAKKQDKLVLWYVYRIIEKSSKGRQMYRAPVLDMYMQQVLFNDPDVASITNSRFVPVRMVCDEVLSKRFGLRPLAFVEPAVVFINGKGEVVHFVERFRTFNAHWFADLQRRVLTKAGAGKSLPGATDPVRAIPEGRWESALAQVDTLSTSNGVDGALLRAQLLRRLRRPDAALQALKGSTRAPKSQVALERGRILTLQGQAKLAIAALKPADKIAEAGYLTALNQLALGDEDRSHATFTEVAAKHPSTLFGRRAKANTERGDDDRPLGAAFTCFESSTYMPEAAYTGLRRDTTWAGKPASAKALSKRALDLLLGNQRADGGFKDSRYAYWPTPKITPNVWIAITALSATALLHNRDAAPQRIDAAIAKAEAYMFKPGLLNRGQNEDVYADAYRLIYLATKKQIASGDAKMHRELVTRMNDVLKEASERQSQPGFFAHEYNNAFCTASMLWGVKLAEKAGATVPPEMISRGIMALVSARYETGSYSYSGAAKNKKRPTGLKDASGRMPACEGVLLANGHGSMKQLRFALDNFWKHIDRLEGVRRNDFHSDGELGGFFFFHAVYHTSEVIKLLPEAEQKSHHAKLLKLVQRIPEMDGSFLDSHEIGRSYGTAMALLILANLQE